MLSISLGVVLICSFIKDVIVIVSVLTLASILFVFFIRQDIVNGFKIFKSMLDKKKLS